MKSATTYQEAALLFPESRDGNIDAEVERLEEMKVTFIWMAGDAERRGFASVAARALAVAEALDCLEDAVEEMCKCTPCTPI